MSRGIVIISGGMDSVTLAHMLYNEGDDLHLLSFDYGQRHKKELQFAAMCAEDLDVRWDIIELHNITQFLAGSALTDSSVEVPDGHYAWDTMKQTVVPNRNAIMLSIATGVAVAESRDYVATAVHAGDHTIYPDCRPLFIGAMNSAMQLGNEGFGSPIFQLRAPFMNISKTEIATIGMLAGVNFTKTWSCYKGGEIHCGTCGTCYERREALRDAGVLDLTEYINNTEVYEQEKPQ